MRRAADVSKENGGRGLGRGPVAERLNISGEGLSGGWPCVPW